jgi:hypothetical protein
VTVLSPPRHPKVDAALAHACCWCAGRIVDERPALAHATVVAATVGSYLPDVSTDLVVVALLHDSPEFAPPDVDLDTTLTAHYGPEVTRLVRALEAEHAALDSGQPLLVDDWSVLAVSTADKIVALSSLLRRARRSGDPDRFFGARQPLLDVIPHFAVCHQHARGRLPVAMTDRLGALVELLDTATAPIRKGSS